jgi:simple sugar transport system substrate-binding protein
MKRTLCASLGLAVLSAALFLGACNNNASTTGAAARPKFELKKVGFSQIGAESDWRKANTISIQDEGKKLGLEVITVDANGKSDKQISDVRSLINQKVDLIILAPLVKNGWEGVLGEAKKAQIPVIIEDRKAEIPNDLYECFIGSDFVEEGRRAARWLGAALPNGANVLVIEGQPGSDAAEGRKQGFEEVRAKEFPKLVIVKSQTGQFDRSQGKEVMAAALKSQDPAKPITAVFAHNDDMALGALDAIKEAAKVPGKDITIVSVDGIKAAFDAMLKKELNCSVECNPLLGPQVFAAAKKIAAGEAVDRVTYSNEKVFDAKDVTKDVVDSRKY